MATYALPEDALLPPWSSQLTVSLAKKPPLLRSVLHPVSQPSGNVHTRKFAGLFVRDFRLPLPALQVAALEETATQPIVSKLQCGILELAWASIACNPPILSFTSTISTSNLSLEFWIPLNPSQPLHPFIHHILFKRTHIYTIFLLHTTVDKFT
jgi:hypothetical protein